MKCNKYACTHSRENLESPNVAGSFMSEFALPLPAIASGSSFSDLYCDSLVGYLEVKPVKVERFPKTVVPRTFSHSHASPHSASSNSSKFSLNCSPLSLYGSRCFCFRQTHVILCIYLSLQTSE